MNNIALIQQIVRRILEGGWPRNIPKRLAFVGCGVFFVFVYYFFYSPSSSTPSASQQCVADQFARKSIDFFEYKSTGSVSFVGNGFIGLDVAVDKQLLVYPVNETSRREPIFTSFRPLVDVVIPFAASDNKFHFVSDYTDGTSKAVHCSIVTDKCVCVSQSIYAHRTRPNLLIQDIRVSNPSTSSLDITFKSRASDAKWERIESGALPVYFKGFDGSNGKVFIGLTCSKTPQQPATIKPQTEEIFVFFTKTAEKFIAANKLSSGALDVEHKHAWQMLNLAAFNISHSKVPDALNADKINATRYALLSSVRAPMLEISQSSVSIKMHEELLSKTELCYSGHSTMLTPSKLWQDWSNIQELLKTVEIWLMTLEHRGCIHVLRAGAHGVAQAYILSLTAATFTHHRLELGLEPESDLHRHIRVENLRFGPTGALINLEFELDSTYKPFVKVSSSRSGNQVDNVLYACSAGCLEAPKPIGKEPVELSIKVTKPVTPILFIAATKSHLEQVKETLHVIEVGELTNLESHKVELHKHGNTGLPTIFWVVLVVVLIAFHLFLFKLLYSEWKNSSSIPYTKFNKRFLLRR
uniref:Uncharacterized protein n=1 Tax=Ditylenchus dipsaci TaxID=166011 RepID=A0A915CWC8_9BILA